MLAGIPSAPGALPGDVCFKAFASSALVEGSASDSFTGSSGRDAMASSEFVDSLFRTLLKCSAQRARMSVFSVSKVTGQKSRLQWNQISWVRKQCEGRHEIFLCPGCQLLLVASQLSSPTSRSSSSAVSAGEASHLLVVLFLLAAGLVVKVILVGLVQLVDELLDVFLVFIEPVLVFPLNETNGICCTQDSLLEGPPPLFQAVMLLFNFGQRFLETSLWCFLFGDQPPEGFVSSCLLLQGQLYVHLTPDQAMIGPVVCSSHTANDLNITSVPLAHNSVVKHVPLT